jgi:hypothetical protein
MGSGLGGLGGLASAAKTILIKINGDASGYKTAVGDAEKSTDALKSKMGTIGRAGILAFAGASAAVLAYSAKTAIANEGVEKGFKRLVEGQGRDVDTYLSNLNKAAQGTLSNAEIMTTANRSIMMGIELDTITEMMEGARIIAAATGQDVSYMFESMALGVARQSPMILDNLGIIMNLEEAYASYADQIGVNVNALTEEQKSTAFTTAAMAAMTETTVVLGDDTDTTALKIAEFQSGVNNLANDIGENLLPQINDTVEAMNEWGTSGGFEDVKFGFGLVTNSIIAAVDILQILGSAVDAVPETLTKLAHKMDQWSGTTRTYDAGYDENLKEYDAEVEDVRRRIDDFTISLDAIDENLIGLGVGKSEAERRYGEDFNTGRSGTDEELINAIKENTKATDDNTNTKAGESEASTSFGVGGMTIKERTILSETISSDVKGGTIKVKGWKPKTS